jgi:hypothetical protein
MKPLSDEELMTRLREEEVPEPSPLFWEHLSQRVHDAVAAEPVPSRTRFGRFNIAWAGGTIAAAAMVVLAVAVSMRHEPAGPGLGPAAVGQAAAADVAAAGNSLPALEDDASFAVMGELASEIDFDQAGAAGLTIGPGSVEDALNQMSDDEQRAAIELLQQEIKNSKSL